jgi:outer membrane biogenesis lipoprotein LolB
MNKKTKTLVWAAVFALLLNSCATQAPKSAALHRAVNQFQECAQYQARRSAGKDPGRMYRNHDRQPHKMTRIPLTNFYIF